MCWWLFSYFQIRKLLIHRVPEENQPLCFMVITLANEHWFSQFFHCEIPQEIFYRPLPPHLSCVATLPCETWKSNTFLFQKQSLLVLVIFFTPPSLWPPNSPDLNPVDYAAWGILQEGMYKHYQITDMEDLLQCVGEEWDYLDQEVIDNAISEWRKRLTAYIAAGGGYFEHSFWTLLHLFIYWLTCSEPC